MAASEPGHPVVIEVSGGVVQAVYSDLQDIDVILIDWDNINEGDAPGTIGYDPLEEMCEDTLEQYRRVTPEGDS